MISYSKKYPLEAKTNVQTGRFLLHKNVQLGHILHG